MLFRSHWNKTSDNISADRGDYSAPYFGDLDNDGDLDMVVGYANYNIDYFTNVGNATNYDFKFNRTFFTISNTWGAPALGDFDNDGDLDMIVGTSGPRKIKYYENNGTASNPDWNYVTDSFLGYDLGREYIIPQIIDWDRDGDLDIITGRYDGYIEYQRNDGNVTDPSWTNVENWGDYGTYVSVAIADLFNDGTYDMMVGYDWGGVNLYMNNAAEPSTSWEQLQGYNFGEGGSYWMEDVGEHSVTRFVDIDADGDLDLLIGNSNGNIKFYENEGLYTDPVNLSTYPTFLHYNGNWINYNSNAHLIPKFNDIDGDGDWDLLVGYQDGRNRYYRNDGSKENPNWVSQGTWMDAGNHGAPAYADIDEIGRAHV